MLRLRGIIVLLMLGLLLSAYMGGPTLAADAKSGTSFGSVDVEKAFDGYDKKKQLDQELLVFADQLTLKYELRKTNRLLTADEFKQLADLTVKPNQNDADKKKIEELLAQSKQREQELQTLQQKQGATDAEKARLKELTDQATNADAVLKDETGKYQGDFAAKQVELSRQVMDEVDAAVAAVAKSKGLSMVFNKNIGDIRFIIFSSVDITDEVLKKLNKT